MKDRRWKIFFGRFSELCNIEIAIKFRHDVPMPISTEGSAGANDYRLSRHKPA